MTDTPWEFPSDYFVDAEQKPARHQRRSRSTAGAGRQRDPNAPAKRELSPEKLEQRAKNIMLHQLSRQAKSAWQLAEVLEKREIPSDISARVIDRFTEAGLIDDRAFAQTVATTRRATRGLSASAIRRELARKGVANNLIDDVLAQYETEDDYELAVTLATKRAAVMRHLEPEVRKRRLFGFLGRKGYSPDIVFRAIRAAEASLG